MLIPVGAKEPIVIFLNFNLIHFCKSIHTRAGQGTYIYFFKLNLIIFCKLLIPIGTENLWSIYFYLIFFFFL